MEENILGFDISVYDIAVVHELNSMADLFDDASNLLLSESAFVSEVIIDISTAAKF